MRIPPVDEYRLPFIVPLGHLAMQAARADNELIALCARTSQPELPTTEVAHNLRNWSSEAKAFTRARIDLIRDQSQRERAIDALQRYESLRKARHRAIHDAVELGIEGDGPLYTVVPIAIQYERQDRVRTAEKFNPVTPEMIADLAYEFYEVQQDLGSIAT